MNARIHNRDGKLPADHWYQIEVNGTHSAGTWPDGSPRKQVIDDKAIESIVNRFNAEREAAGENWPGMLVDADHLSHDLENSTEAFAWAQELAVRDGQLFARLDPTDIGEPAIRNRRYKFFSTEYDPEDVEDLGDGAVRPLRLSGLAFTNRPNNKGGKPISNRDPNMKDTSTKGEAGDDTGGSVRKEIKRLRDAGLSLAEIGVRINRSVTTMSSIVSGEIENPPAALLATLRSISSASISNRDGTLPGGHPQKNNTMQPIATKLGLPADADEAAILAKLTDFMSELEALKGKAADTEAEAILNRYGERIPKEKRDDVKKRLITNREDTVAMLDLLPAPEKAKATTERIFNRGGASAPAPVADGELGEEEKCRKQNALLSQIRNREKCNFETAWNMARSEAPELF